MLYDPFTWWQWFLAYCEASVSSILSPLRDVLTLSMSLLPSNVYILISFQSELELCIVVLDEFGRNRAWDMEALLRERRKGKFCMYLPSDKSEEGHAKKTSSSMCR